jgi:hypothetical protein
MKCSSTSCTSLNCAYCPECSHSIYFGEGKDKNGKVWKWEFNSRFGPVFLKKDGQPLKNQPSEKNTIWPVFEKWHKNKKWIGADNDKT